MKDQKALAYANMYGVLGALENLCELDNKAKEILKQLKKPVSICFDVKEGPCRTFHFDQSGCKITEGSEGAAPGKQGDAYSAFLASSTTAANAAGS